MRLASALVGVLVSSLLLSSPVTAQETATASVPRVVRLTGTFHPANGLPPAQVETVTLSIYADESGGTALWEETQSVAIDSSGQYSMLLGASRPEGLPLDLFASGEARWLAVRFERSGDTDPARVRLTSVPYALRAADADTLGGKPASAYVLTEATSNKSSSEATPTRSAPLAVAPGTPNFLAKYVNTADVGDSGVYESGGSVGVGTTTPLDFMHVRFTNTGGNFTGYAVQNLGSTATSYSGMLFYDQNGALGQFQGFNNSTHEYRINNVAAGGTINFMTGSNSRFFVGNTGNIGIGTSTPAVGFEHARNGFADSYFTSYVSGSASFIVGRHARGTMAAPTAIQNGDGVALFGGQGYTGTSFVHGAYIYMTAVENFTATTTGTRMGFFTTTIGSTGPLERMTIEDGGDVGIGITTPADKLQVFGDVRVGNAGTNGCVKNFAGTGLIGVCTSDKRFKRDITPFAPALNAVARLQPVHYYWRATEFPERHFGDARTYGLVAQDVERVLPELVVTNSDGYKAVDYSKLPLLTIQAIKELKIQNDGLQSAVADLQEELRAATRLNDEMRSRLTALERLVRETSATHSRR